MKSITFVLLLVVLGCAIAQETSLRQQVTDAFEDAGIFDHFDNPNSVCRRITRDMLGGCVAELYSGESLDVIESSLISQNILGQPAVDPFSLSFELQLASFDTRQILSQAGCCSFVCELAQQSCTCDFDSASALAGIFDTFERDILELLQQTCESQNINLNYDIPRFQSDLCSDSNAGTRESYVCS